MPTAIRSYERLFAFSPGGGHRITPKRSRSFLIRGLKPTNLRVRSMLHFAAWYRREDYQRIREIMLDGPTFPAEFEVWEKTAQKQLVDAKAQGVDTVSIILDPDEFLTFCREKGFLPNAETRAEFTITRGAVFQRRSQTCRARERSPGRSASSGVLV